MSLINVLLSWIKGLWGTDLGRSDEPKPSVPMYAEPLHKEKLDPRLRTCIFNHGFSCSIFSLILQVEKTVWLTLFNLFLNRYSHRNTGQTLIAVSFHCCSRPHHFTQICVPHASLGEGRGVLAAILMFSAQRQDEAKKPAFWAGIHIQRCPLTLLSLLPGPWLIQLLLLLLMIITTITTATTIIIIKGKLVSFQDDQTTHIVRRPARSSSVRNSVSAFCTPRSTTS